MPPWFFEACAIALILALCISLWWITLGAKRFSQAMGRENKLIKLQDDLRKTKDQNLEYQGTASQVTTAIVNSQSFIDSLNHIYGLEDPRDIRIKSVDLIQRIIEALASDVKSKPGDKHRCGLWVLDDDDFLLAFGSTGFPENYIGSRRLNVNWSVAGKSFRKGQTLSLPDVTKDDEWQRNADSNSAYTSLICIPIDPWGVLTVDGLNPMNDDVKNIGELYCSILTGAISSLNHAVEKIEHGSYAEASATASE
jgi:putative methionine-R-sulfoxide reductase with GAF domain